jgi:sulfatase maturation enzyme AslB (radical SAM superfamily)
MPCCEYMPEDSDGATTAEHFDQWWNQELDQLRSKMINNQSDPACGYCRSKEHNPNLSNLRKHTNKKYSDNIIPIINEYQQAGTTQGPRSVEIRFGNYCNLKCIMCGPYASSSIYQEYLENRDLFNSKQLFWDADNTNRWWEKSNSLEQLKKVTDQAETLMFTGGEPMMVPEVIDFLNRANSNCEINFVTNLTRLSPRMLDALKKFRRVNIMVSLEGVGSHNDYIRYGSVWKEIDQSIEKLKTLGNIHLSINTVLQHTSVFSLPPLIEYATSQNISINYGQVYSGSVDGSDLLSINSVPPAQIKQFQDYVDSQPHPAIKKWLQTYEFDPAKHARFLEYINMLDQIRGVNFAKTFGVDYNLV